MDDYTNFSDIELQKLSSEDDKAEEELLKRYKRKVIICASRYFLFGGDPSDLQQEGTIGLISAIRNYNPDSGFSFNNFAEICIRNKIRDAVKSLKYAEFLHTDSLIDNDKDIIDPNGSPEEQYLRDEDYRELVEEIKKALTKLEKNVLELLLQGFSPSEIADKSGKNIISVYNALQRIRAKLAQNLNPATPAKAVRK